MYCILHHYVQFNSHEVDQLIYQNYETINKLFQLKNSPW